MENQEEILDVLTVFEKKPSREIPPVLEEYLANVAKTGKTLFPWNRLKPLFITKLEQVMEELNKDMPFDHLAPYPNVENSKYEDMKKRIVEALQRFNGAPFTVQRICELVTDPTKHYTRCDKFLRGIEKNVMVVSTVDPFGRKIVSDSYRAALVNGLDLNGFSQQKVDSNDINDGQPFAPWTDWPSNSLASMWPLAMGNGTSVSKPSFTEQSAHTQQPSTDENLNNNQSSAEDFTVDSECDSDSKYKQNNVDSTEFQDAFVPKESTSESISEQGDNHEETTDSSPNVSGEDKENSCEPVSTATVSDTAQFNFETKQSEAESTVDSTGRCDDSNTQLDEPTDSHVDSTDTSAEAEQAESDDSNDTDGPPEKKMKLSHRDEDAVCTPEQSNTEEAGESESAVSEKPKIESTEEKDLQEAEPTQEPSSDTVDSSREEDEKEITSQSETPPVSDKPDIVTSTEEGITEQQNDNHSESVVKDSADTSTENPDIDSDSTVCKDEDNTGNTCTEDNESDTKVDTTTTEQDDNGAVNEAMETEQVDQGEDKQPSEETTESSETIGEVEDETEPMDHE